MENKHTFGFSPCQVKVAGEAKKDEKKKSKKDKEAVAPAQREADNAAVPEQETGEILAQ